MTDDTPRSDRSSRLGLVAGRVLLSAASGALLYLSFPPRPLWWLAPLAFAGLGLVLHGRRPWAGLGYGFVFGLTFYLMHLVWIQDFLGADFGSAPWLALSALQAGFAAVACAAMTLVARFPAAAVWMAALFIGQETLRTAIPLNGFPWGRVGFSQPEGAFTSLASVGGTTLVGFAVVLTGFGIARLAVGLVSRRFNAAKPSRHPIAGVAAFAVVPVLAGLAVWPTVGTEATAGTLRVAVVQGNAPDVGIGLLEPAPRTELRRNHLAQAERLAQDIEDGTVAPPDLVVWPETATAVAGNNDDVQAAVERLGVPSLVGSVYRRTDGGVENAVVAWDPDRGPMDRYTKQELVPFAEYVPWRTIAGFFTPFMDDTADMVAGDRPAVLTVAEVRVGLAICYEAAYDYVARQAVDNGATMLAIPTNNAWYGPGEMTYQQLAMSRLRAVEHGRAVVVSATSGVSAIVRPDGSIVSSTSLFTAESLVEEIPLRNGTTVATFVGAWPERVIVGGGVIALVVAIGLRGARRTGREENGG